MRQQVDGPIFFTFRCIWFFLQWDHNRLQEIFLPISRPIYYIRFLFIEYCNKISTHQQWHRRHAEKLSTAARRSTKVGGGAARSAHGSTWRCQVEDGRQLISCAIFLKFKLLDCKLNVWA